MLQFWRSIFYSDFAAPIFKKAADIMGVTAQVCKEYCTSGMIEYGLRYFLLTLVVLGALIGLGYLAHIKCWLNPGNSSKYASKTLAKKEGSPLKGKNILFLGSSVTLGFGSCGDSFVDMIARTTGANCTKFAVSGTTLVDKKSLLGDSYITRMKQIDPKTPCDIFVCQLSTNDATKKLPLDDVRSATKEIIDYVKKTWNCPMVFYTNPEYDDANYAAMVDMLKDLAKTEDIQIVDLWDDEVANLAENKSHTKLVGVHPTKKGYQVWAPIIEEGLAAVAQGKKIPQRAKKSAAAPKKKSNVGKILAKVLCCLLAVLILFGATIGLSTYKQLVVVKGLKNEGNAAKYNPENYTVDPNSPIVGKKLLWLGSSVWMGFGTAESMSPALWMDAM
ncbi:MAG: SGNH/GDSL hydrolase family protein, partial [Clostridia bacterium]|nr:SGNH/GDSL hydrolase family protein [Clostridia bacterium]